MIGHSYFMAENDDQLQLKYLYEVKPIIKEYIKDGILIAEAQKEIDKLNE
jgi:5-methylcytosine-specific restriction enzyme B